MKCSALTQWPASCVAARRRSIALQLAGLTRAQNLIVGVFARFTSCETGAVLLLDPLLGGGADARALPYAFPGQLPRLPARGLRRSALNKFTVSQFEQRAIRGSEPGSADHGAGAEVDRCRRR